MYCQNCGKEISENATWCRHCGQQVETNTTDREASPRTISLMAVVQWITGVLLMLYGLAFVLIGYYLSGMIVIVGGAYMLPFIEKAMISKLNFSLSKPLKIVVIIMLVIFPLMILDTGADIESDRSYTYNPESYAVEEDPLDYLEITYTDGYFTETSTHILFTVENTGLRDVEFVRVQISLYDEDGNLIKTDDPYPSPYDSWGLPAGESFDYEREYYGIKAAKRQIKITSARFV